MALWESGGFVEVACVHVTKCKTWSCCVCSQWTLTGMCRPQSTIQITDALQGADEGRALGLPNPGSSVFHVLRLPAEFHAGVFLQTENQRATLKG